MQMKLVVTAGASKSGEIAVKPPMTLGRSRDADLTLRHALISRKHCEIIESNDAIIVRDLGSLNGTYVDGERINEAALKAGDELTVGSVTFRVDLIAPDAPAAPHAAATQEPVPQGVDPETGLQFLEPVDAVETVPVEEIAVAQETASQSSAPQPAAAQSSVVGALEHDIDETIQQPQAVAPVESAADPVADIPLAPSDDAIQPAAASQIDFAPADEDAPSVVNSSDISFEVAEEQTAPDTGDSALGSFLKKL